MRVVVLQLSEKVLSSGFESRTLVSATNALLTKASWTNTANTYHSYILFAIISDLLSETVQQNKTQVKEFQ